MRKAADLLRDRADTIAPLSDHGAGQAAARGQGRGAGRRRRDRLVRRGSPPHLWPRHSRPGRGHLPARGQGTGRPGRRVHAVEFPDQPGGAQAVHRAGRGLLDHRQGTGGNPRVTRRTDPLLRRCRRARGRDQPGLRRAVGDLRISHSASDHPQDVVHRLHRGRQATRRDRRPAHEARHHGTGRPRTGDRVRRRRCRNREPAAGGCEVSQCRPGLRVADARSWCRRTSTTSSSTRSSATPRR